MDIFIKYFVNNKEYSSRNRCHVPRVGDVIRFRDGFFSVVTVVWIEDSNRHHVAIDLEKEKQD